MQAFLEYVVKGLVQNPDDVSITPVERNGLTIYELRLNQEFDLTSTSATTILLDFDGDQSVQLTGNGQYMMTPVISVVSVQ